MIILDGAVVESFISAGLGFTKVNLKRLVFSIQ